MMTLPLLMIFVARIFDGFTGGNISVANAYLSDISTDEDRNTNFGKMGASTSLGFVLGPAVAGILASTLMGEALPLLLAALISLVAIFVINNRLEETNPCVVDTGTFKLKSFRRFFQVEHKNCYGSTDKGKVKTNTWKAILAIPGIPLLYTVYFLTFLAFSLFYAGLPIYANTLLGWSATDLGLFLAYSSLIMILTQGPLLSRLVKVVSNENLILVGSLLLATGFYLLSSNTIIVIYLANTIFSIGNGMMWPSFLALLSSTGTKQNQGAIQGYGNSMGSIASMLGLILGGMLFESISTTVFVIGALVFLVITLLMAGRFLRRKKVQPAMT